MNNQNGLLTQKPETPVPMVGKLYEWLIIPMKSKSGKAYTKLKNPDERKGEHGTACEVLSVEKTGYTDSYGNVSYNVGYQIMGASGSGPQTSQDARSTAFPAATGDNRSQRIERQHSQEMALRLAAAFPQILGAPEEVSMKKLRWYVNWFVKDIGSPPLQETPRPEPPEPRRTVGDQIHGEPEPVDHFMTDECEEIPF